MVGRYNHIDYKRQRICDVILLILSLKLGGILPILTMRQPVTVLRH